MDYYDDEQHQIGTERVVPDRCRCSCFSREDRCTGCRKKDESSKTLNMNNIKQDYILDIGDELITVVEPSVESKRWPIGCFRFDKQTK